MAITFKSQDHKYYSNDGTDIDWISATGLIGALKNPFDAVAQSQKSSRNKKSKWYNMDPLLIQQIWDSERDRSTTLGSWYHNEQERSLCSLDNINRYGKELKIIKPSYDTSIDEKYAGSQKLDDGIYPEHLVYLKSAGLCGQSDLVEVADKLVHITDYKTNKEIDTESYVNWEGISKRMLYPVSHLDDCDLMHYSLQLSLYMFMILKHNPKLNPGTMTIHHVLFEKEKDDQYGYPITKRDDQGNPIVLDVVPYNIDYLKSEVISIIHYLNEHRESIKKTINLKKAA